MKLSIFAILVCCFPSYAMRYDLVQSTAVLENTASSKSFSVHIRLHNTGDQAAGCFIYAGGKKILTGISGRGDAEVTFEHLSHYNGYKLDCRIR